MRIITSIFGMIAMPAVACAGGSIDFTDVSDLLKERPEYAVVVSALDVEATGFAEIVIDFKQPHLGGRRLGPYIFKTKSHQNQSLELLLCTKPHFKDANGRSTNFFDATTVGETLNAVILRRPGSAVTCPIEDDT